MPEVVKVSSVDNNQHLMSTIETYFKAGRYAELTQAIGIHSILIDSEHTMHDQANLYHIVLRLIKEKIQARLGKRYSAWYVDFPKLLDDMVTSGNGIGNKNAASMLASRHEAFGPFKSLDDFFFWSLDDRRLTLEEIVNFIEKTETILCH